MPDTHPAIALSDLNKEFFPEAPIDDSFDTYIRDGVAGYYRSLDDEMRIEVEDGDKVLIFECDPEVPYELNKGEVLYKKTGELAPVDFENMKQFAAYVLKCIVD